MNPRPYRPTVELEGALARGDLDYAITLAVEVSGDRRRPVELPLALAFLPLIASQRPDEYDAWALRWLARWIQETAGATIEHAAEVAGLLADVPTEPRALESMRAMTTRTRPQGA
jgi:hypothetical protein